MTTVHQVKVLVGVLTKQTLKDRHDVYIMPSGRIYYRHNLGRFENGEPVCKAGPLLDLCRALFELKSRIVDYIEAQPEMRNGRLMRDLARAYGCELDFRTMTVDHTAL